MLNKIVLDKIIEKFGKEKAKDFCEMESYMLSIVRREKDPTEKEDYDEYFWRMMGFELSDHYLKDTNEHAGTNE